MPATPSRIIGAPLPAGLCTASGRVAGGPLVTVANTEPHDHDDGQECYAAILLAGTEDRVVAV